MHTFPYIGKNTALGSVVKPLTSSPSSYHIWKGSYKSRKHRPQWWCLSFVGGGDSNGPTVILVLCGGSDPAKIGKPKLCK